MRRFIDGNDVRVDPEDRILRHVQVDRAGEER